MSKSKKPLKKSKKAAAGPRTKLKKAGTIQKKKDVAPKAAASGKKKDIKPHGHSAGASKTLGAASSKLQGKVQVKDSMKPKAPMAPAGKKTSQKPSVKVETTKKPLTLDKHDKKSAVAPKPAAPMAKAAPAVAKDENKAKKAAPAVDLKAPAPKKAPKVEVHDEAKESEDFERLKREILGTDGENNDDVVPTDAEGNPYCKVKDCDQLARVDRYCRYHYLLLWKKIQLRKKILADGKLEKYIEDLTSRYPDKYIEMIRRDLKTEKDFLAAIQELEIDDSGLENEFDEESENLMDEVRGISRPTGREGDDDF